MRNEIIVIYSDAWREREIAHIPMCYKNRARVNDLLDSLNARYAGYGRFYAREITHAGKPTLEWNALYQSMERHWRRHERRA